MQIKMQICKTVDAVYLTFNIAQWLQVLQLYSNLKMSEMVENIEILYIHQMYIYATLHCVIAEKGEKTD
jgi:hypothetical protein